MSSSQEKFNIILMRDSGESKRIRMPRSRFRTIVFLIFLCPILAITFFCLSYYLWQENANLRHSIQEVEDLNQEYKITTKRLRHLEQLLKPNNSVLNAISENIAENRAKEAVNSKKNSGTKTQNTADDDGPGHEIFPVIDTKEVIIQNVSCNLTKKNILRTSLELRNEHANSISGEVKSILILNSGQIVNLVTRPNDAGKYKISKFKSTVLITVLDKNYDLTNAQIVIEAKNDTGTVIYRNIYPVSQ